MAVVHKNGSISEEEIEPLAKNGGNTGNNTGRQEGHALL